MVVNCPTLSEELLASELFGHARGAFTGAVRDQAGRVEAAEGGTLFLDEIGEISPALQAKLLRFLQDREFERVGENRTRRADVRIVAATNRDLEADVAAGRFREDLYCRLVVVEIAVPPLRERPEDVLRLARALPRVLRPRGQAPRADALARTPSSALARATRWPGNVRELRNAMERARSSGRPTSSSRRRSPSASPGRRTPAPRVGGDCHARGARARARRCACSRARATLEEAARILGIDESTLWRKRKRYGL